MLRLLLYGSSRSGLFCMLHRRCAPAKLARSIWTSFLQNPSVRLLLHFGLIFFWFFFKISTKDVETWIRTVFLKACSFAKTKLHNERFYWNFPKFSEHLILRTSWKAVQHLITVQSLCSWYHKNEKLWN